MVRNFEKEALYIDSRIADKKDREFVKYLKAFRWSLTDVTLFDGLEYDKSCARDHFFSDQLRLICDICSCSEGTISLETFFRNLKRAKYKELLPLLKYFDGLKKNEKRLRWDRLVIFHLLQMAFINSFGYNDQKQGNERFQLALQQIQNNQIKINFEKLLPRLKLEKAMGIKHLKKAMELFSKVVD